MTLHTAQCTFQHSTYFVLLVIIFIVVRQIPNICKLSRYIFEYTKTIIQIVNSHL